MPSKPLSVRPDPIPTGEWMARLRAAMFNAVTERDMQELVASLLEKAKKGDLGAARLLLSYVVGSPNLQIENAVVVAGPHAGVPLTLPERRTG